MDTPPVGEQELEVLEYIARHAPVAAREVADRFGEQHGLARTTILTVIERLRRKGFLTRRRRDGVFQYSPRVAISEVIQGLVAQFFEQTLGGSVSPVVAYLSRTHRVSQRELDELERLVADLKAERGPK